MRVRELVLDDRDRRAEVVQRGRVRGRAQVRGGGHELGVGGHGEDPADALQVLRGHVLQALDQLPGGEVLPDLVLAARGEVLDGGGHGLLT